MENNSELLSVPQFQEDLISKLPDDILVDILSTLKLKEAAQTSILSHRWLNLWTHVPRLHLVSTVDQRQPRTPKQKKKDMRVFANWVNRVLDLRKSSYLREFRIIRELDKCYQNEIDKWLEYALGTGVQRLELNLSLCGFSAVAKGDRYNFPNQLLHQTTKLGVQLAPKVGFSSLRELYFLAVNISGEAIECLLLKCPLLEDLRVIGSSVLVNLVVSGPSLLLKHLEITSCLCADSIKISNTNIVSLKLYVREKGCRLSLNNLPMLTEVWMKGQFPNKSIFFSQLSCCLSQLTVLTLQAVDPKTIMELYKFPELQNLRRLVLVANCCEYKSLIGLTSLIDSCPHLVEFALMLHPVDDKSCGVQEKAMEQMIQLKVFELYGYHGNYACEHELMMFFIENAAALEKIVIDPRTISTLHGCETVEDERAKESRTHAVEKYKGLVPQQVELVILWPALEWWCPGSNC